MDLRKLSVEDEDKIDAWQGPVRFFVKTVMKL